MGLIVRETGLRSWLVDSGRTGARALGVPLSGAADHAAFRLGNALVGNDASAVALEVTLLGPTLVAEHAVACVVFGAPFNLRINGEREVSSGTTFTLEAGETLKVAGTSTGCRGYLCVKGGFESALKLGSRSAFGPIRVGERLKCRESRIKGRGIGFANLDEHRADLLARRASEGTLKPSLNQNLSAGQTDRSGSPVANPRWRVGLTNPGEQEILRALPGNQADWFPDDTFWNSEFTVSPASDRMGLRLQGPKLEKRSGEMASEAVAPGAVQVANDGLPIVLGVDGQTIGGYPKVAHVIAADLDRLAQLRPGDAVRFARVGMDEAEELANERRKQIVDWVMRLNVSNFA